LLRMMPRYSPIVLSNLQRIRRRQPQQQPDVRQESYRPL
jgi:hypothetical protein